MDRKELIQDIESTYGFLVAILVIFVVVAGLYLKQTGLNLIPNSNPESIGYLFVPYVVLSYVGFKIFARSMRDKYLRLLRVLLLLDLFLLVAPIGFLASQNGSLLVTIEAILSLPLMILGVVCLVLPFALEGAMRILKKK